MKAIQITTPGVINLIDKEIPVAKEGEALLKVKYCGICGADVASYTGNQPFTTYPRIPGHEFSAEIVSVPENDKGLKSGDIITCNPYFNCGGCYACKRGIVNACYDNQTQKFIKEIKSADENAFFIVTQSKQMEGRGQRMV